VTTRIAFLRALNVGRRTVPMSRLVEVFEGLGYDGAWTHINSGNVVFEAAGGGAALEGAIEKALESTFGFEITTFVRTAAALGTSLRLDPFRLAKGDTYFITFLKKAPSAAAAKALEAASNDFDTLVVHGREVHWRMRGRSTDTTVKKATWDRLGEHGSTSRNVTMLRKLQAKLDA
jgi:uncharacterized protein (DUF1697 family)